MPITADSYILDVGNVDSGALADTYTDNATYFVIEEVTGNPGFDLKLYFENLDDTQALCYVYLNGYYEGNPAHRPKIQRWNFTLGQWDDFTADLIDFPSRATEDDYQFETVHADYVQNQQLRIRIYHNWAGTPGHHFHIDYLRIESAIPKANDPELTFKRDEVQKVFKHAATQKVFKHAEVQKVFKYQLTSSVN